MAPFYSLVGNIIDHTAIIHDLNVVTTITTDGHYAGGMVGYVYHSASISNGGQAIAVPCSASATMRRSFLFARSTSTSAKTPKKPA